MSIEDNHLLVMEDLINTGENHPEEEWINQTIKKIALINMEGCLLHKANVMEIKEEDHLLREGEELH